MEPRKLHLHCVNGYDDRPEGPSVMAEKDPLAEIAEKEHEVLRELIRLLDREKRAITTLSLGGIVELNNEKERVVLKLASLKIEREKLMVSAGKGKTCQKDVYLLHTPAMKKTILETKAALNTNARLLSLSASRVGSAIETIVRFINRASPAYGKKAKLNPILFSRRV